MSDSDNVENEAGRAGVVGPSGNEIKDKLAPYICNGILAIGKDNQLGSSRLNALLSTWFGGTLTAKVGDAQVNTASVVFENTDLSTAGFTLYSKATAVKARLTFTAGSDGAIDCSVAAAMPIGYTLTDSFAKIPAYSPLAQLKLIAALFTVASAAETVVAQFAGTVPTEESTFESFAWLFGKEVTVTGKVSFKYDLPVFTLQSQPVKSPQVVSGFELNVTLNLRCTPATILASDGSRPLLAVADLTCALVANDVELPVSIGILGKGRPYYPVSLDRSKPATSITSLDQLKGFTGGKSPADLLTTDTPIGRLSLDNVSVMLELPRLPDGSIGTPRLSNFSLTVGLGTDWWIIPNVLELKGLQACIMAPNLFGGGAGGGAGNMVQVAVNASLKLGNAELIAAVLYPDKVVGIGLAPGATVSINDFLGTFAQGLKLPGNGDLTVTKLSAMADIGHKSYSLQCAADGNLSIIKGFVLNEIEIALTYSDGSLSEFQFGSRFSIAETLLYLGVIRCEGGWVLSGGTDHSGQGIKLSSLITDLLKIFEIQLPTDLPAIVLSDLEMQEYKTADGSFRFLATIQYVNEGDPILKRIVGSIEIGCSGTPKKTWTGSVSGAIEVGANQFGVKYDFNKTKTLELSWTATGDATVGIGDLCSLFDLSVPTIPQDLDLGLKKVLGEYNITDNRLLLECESKNYGKSIFAAFKEKRNGSKEEKWQFYFGLAAANPITLSQLPLVGSEIARFGQVALEDIAVEVSVPPLTATQAQKISNKIPADYPRPPADGLTDKVALSLVFDADGNKTPISFSVGSKPSPAPKRRLKSAPALPAALRATADAPATASDSTTWFAVQKSIGPVSIQKVGVRYADSKLWALMNASFSLGGLQIGLMGLGMGSPLTTFQPSFTVSGITASLKVGEVAFSGALTGKIDPVDLYGEFSLQLGNVSLGAFAGYADYQKHPSFFLYATLNAPLGGPAYFFVTGLAAGFGVNRQLVVPDVSGVNTFPLVQWAVGTKTPGASIKAAMNTLSESGVIAPSIGQYWMAAGLRFRSVELLDTVALVTVSLGKPFELNLLGLSTLSLPPPPPGGASAIEPFAVAQLALKASFVPSEGVLAITGQLTSASYVLSKDCHITGGFAFYLWFTGDHAGDFVVSFGGYSNKFKKPDHYPAVPRLGLSWQVNPNLSITGGLYFAITPSAVLAGGSLKAVWQSDTIRAWFNLEVDFLLVFQPLHYYLTASIELGVSALIDLKFTKKRFTTQLGVLAEIWGPDFSGEVHVDLRIISFTISFGAAQRGGLKPVSWEAFATQLLPKKAPPHDKRLARRQRTAMRAIKSQDALKDTNTPAVLQINVVTGVVKSFTEDSTELDWLVDDHSFQLTVVSNIPVKEHTFGSGKIELAPAEMQPQSGGRMIKPNTDFGVGPTGTASKDFTSCLTLTIESKEDNHFQAVMQLQNISKALWQKREFDKNGVPIGVDPLNDTTIPNVLTGFTLAPKAQPPDHRLSIQVENLQYTRSGASQTLAWSKPVIQPSDPFKDETVAGTIGVERAAANRSALIAAINRAGFAVSNQVDVSTLAKQATNSLLAQPVRRYLGEAR
ncbi:MAG: DUF6603 domain-containing protein [Candidatus Competibacteraceae bacterium]